VEQSKKIEILAIGDEIPSPIQKIISVPMKERSGFQGVVQICRKGTYESLSIPDFTVNDLEILARAAAVISSHMKQGERQIPSL
jgi:hypothetical protein